MHFWKQTPRILVAFGLLLSHGFAQPTKALAARRLSELLSKHTQGLRDDEKKLAHAMENRTNLTKVAEVGKQYATELIGTGLTIAGLAGIVAPEFVIPASVAGGIALEKAKSAATESAEQGVNGTETDNVSIDKGDSNGAKDKQN